MKCTVGGNQLRNTHRFLADVMLVSPSWTTYAPQCRLAGHEPIVVETSFESEWKVRPEALESALNRPGPQSNKLLVLNNPGNPCEATEIAERAVMNVL